MGFCQVHRAHNVCRVSLVIVHGVDFITSGVPLPATHAAQLGSATCGSRRSRCGVKGRCGVCGLQGRPGSGPRRLSASTVAPVAPVVIAKKRAEVAKARPGENAQAVVLGGRYDGRAEGVQAVHGWRPRALQYMFLKERVSTKFQVLTAKPGPLDVAGIVGIGFTGGGITMCCTEADTQVFLLDR